MRQLTFFVIFCAGWLTSSGQPQYNVTYYDEEDGLPHAHITQLLQDEKGFIWLATWNGLCRYDGYEFRTFKAQMGDGCRMTTDRFRDIALRPDGQMVCRVDEDYYLFDTHTYRFSNLSDSAATSIADDIKRYRTSKSVRYDNGLTSFALTDRQGNEWAITPSGLKKETTVVQHTKRIGIEPQAEVKCLFKDNQQRYWVCTKGDAAVRVYSCTDDQLLGYLGIDGRLHQGYTAFGFPIYCMYQTTDGTLWLGSKQGGLFHLQETSAGAFHITHFANLPDKRVYSIFEDCFGRLWVATLGGGLYYAALSQNDQLQFHTPNGYPKDVAQRVRNLLLVQQGEVMMAATTEGLIIAKLEQDANKMRFHRHLRESNRATSLSSSAIMNMMTGSDGRIYISTESGGINSIEGSDLLADSLTFQHYTASNNKLPSDVIMSLTPMDEGGILMVGSHLIAMIDSIGHYRQLDARYFNADYRFSDAHPLQLNKGRWLFGLMDGAFITSTEQMRQQTYSPQLVLTGISIQGGSENLGVAYWDTLTLQPHERSVTVHFAAIDYCGAERISYAFRLQHHTEWNYIGHDRSATLLDLEPGTYQLEMRSTNADGLWQDNIRTLTIIVKPTFFESIWGRLLILLLITGTLFGIVYTLLYIRRIKRKQRETLEAYLALLESQTGNGQGATSQPSSQSDHTAYDPMLKRVMDFIEANISNADASVGDMAAAAATSRSGLQRKLKQTMGITPQDLLREARTKHACKLLRETDKSVAEVAYACGFTDPKYFSRCFKQSTGKSPSEYKTATPHAD